MHRGLAVLFVFLLAAVATGGSVAQQSATAATPDESRIVGLYPNPVTDGDAGEFVVISVPTDANLSQYAIADGETTVDLPSLDGNRTVLLSTDANRTAALVDGPVHQLPGRLELANGGERVELRRDNETVDALAYEDAPEGAVLRDRGGDGPEWDRLGATDRPVVTAGAGTVEAFVLPDAGGRPVATLESAEDRILLAGYTLTSRRVASALRRAHRRNVTVRVLLEGAPVGGVATRQARLLDALAADGADVRVVGGDRARYRYHHPKYAVVDDRALVTTENWKPAGTGGHSSRGWGVSTNQSRIVRALAATFRADAGWLDAIPWERYRRGVENTTAAAPATGSYPTTVAPRQVPVDRTSLLVAPDNAEAEVLARIDAAEESLWIEQAGVGGVDQPFVRASVDAARRGVSVRILLGNAWYNREDNRAIADRLDAIAAREDLDLETRLVEPRGRFDRLHAKGAVIDGEQAILGSLNWNNNSARNNREVALVLTGEAVGGYYEAVVRADWRGGRWRVPAGVLLAVGLALALAGLVSRRIRFESGEVRPAS